MVPVVTCQAKEMSQFFYILGWGIVLIASDYTASGDIPSLDSRFLGSECGT